ncbi:MAG: response regulator [Leptospirales bacterium]|nr:response regulator [Leptospirales bacterium]
MPLRVLDVGQCRPDHSSIRYLFESLGAQVEQSQLIPEALERVANEKFDLVLVNRKLDYDYSDGTELIRQMKENPVTRDTPVMLISNYEEAQQEAVGLGAEPGFGKLELSDPGVRNRLKQFLTRRAN